jgi:hypothetical protein
MMRYLDESGSMVERSTKEVNRKKAREIAEDTERVFFSASKLNSTS